jgi:hypothetical protein
VELFDKLNFNSAAANVVYILCSDHCCHVARHEFGYSPAPVAAHKCPEPIDVSFGFGASSSLEEQIQKVNHAKEVEASASSDRSRRGTSYRTMTDLSEVKESKKPVVGDAYLRWKALPFDERAIEKMRPCSGEVIAVYSNFKDAAKPIGMSHAGLYSRLREKNPSHWAGYLWELTEASKARASSTSGGESKTLVTCPPATASNVTPGGKKRSQT